MKPDQHRSEKKKKKSNLNSFYYEVKEIWRCDETATFCLIASYSEGKKKESIFSVNKKGIWFHTTEQHSNLIFGQVFGPQEQRGRMRSVSTFLLAALNLNTNPWSIYPKITRRQRQRKRKTNVDNHTNFFS